MVTTAPVRALSTTTVPLSASSFCTASANAVCTMYCMVLSIDSGLFHTCSRYLRVALQVGFRGETAWFSRQKRIILALNAINASTILVILLHKTQYLGGQRATRIDTPCSWLQKGIRQLHAA